MPGNRGKDSDSHVEIDTAGTTLTGGTSLLTFVVGPTGTEVFDVHKLDLRIEPGEVVTIAAKTFSGNTDLAASMAWIED